jgi:peroxiredoxin
VNNFFFTSRKTFLIDEKGILVHIIDEVNLNSHPQDVLNIFNKVQQREK